MNIKQLQIAWNEAGKSDPFWAILNYPDKKGNKWEPFDFFYTGRQEIDRILSHVQSLGLNFGRKRALDFGCGVGRLTQALVGHFDEVYGIDVAPSMINLAQTMNQYGDRCTYCVNETDNLSLFPDHYFDFVYTSITLQHMEPRYARQYIKEFLRVLLPDALLMLQLPSEPNPGAYCGRPEAPSSRRPWKEMYGIKHEEVVAFLETNGATIVEAIQDQTLPAPQDWVSFRYCATKRPERNPESQQAGLLCSSRNTNH